MLQSSFGDLSCAERYRANLVGNLSSISDDNLRQLLPDIAPDLARKFIQNPRILPTLAHIAAARGLPLPVLNTSIGLIFEKVPIETLAHIVGVCIELSTLFGVLPKDKRKQLASAYGGDLLTVLWTHHEDLIKPFVALFPSPNNKIDLQSLVDITKDDNTLHLSVWSGQISRHALSIVTHIIRVLTVLESTPNLAIMKTATKG